MSAEPGLAYLDTSAYVKLIVDEAESEALVRELQGWSAWTSSALLAVEAVRACRRVSDTAAQSAEAHLRNMALIPVDDDVVQLAKWLDPPELRSLDAIHLATALTVRDDIDAIFGYDERLTATAREAGLRVLSPR